MNIAIIGWYGHGNCGDEAFKLAFADIFNGHNLTFFDEGYGTLIDFSQVDIVVLGGGDVLKPPYVTCLYNCGKPLVAVSVTVTEESDLKNISRFDRVFVRDKASLEIAKNNHCNPDAVMYLPDITFVLKPDARNGRILLEKRFAAEGHFLTDKIITVVVNDYISFNSNSALARDVLHFNNLVHSLAEICEKMNESWVFLPFSTKPPTDDRPACAWLGNRCREKYTKNLTIYDKLSPQETLDVIAASTAVISSRLHSTIFSAIAGVPFIDILHHDKNYGMIQTLECEDWSNWLWHFKPSKVKELLEDFMTVDRSEKLKAFTKKSREEIYNADILIF